nr:hypothetical protein [Rhodoferax sp.]
MLHSMSAGRSHEEATIQEFKEQPELAAAYLESVLRDGDDAEVFLTIQRVAAAFSESDPVTDLLVCSVPGVPGLHTQGQSAQEIQVNLLEAALLLRSEVFRPRF